MGNRDINKVYRFCRLLHIDSIRNEIEEKIKGYNLDDIKLEQGKFVCTFHKNELSSVILTASLGSIILTKYEGSNVERITVDENLIMINTSVEKRESGIIYFILQKLLLLLSALKMKYY